MTIDDVRTRVAAIADKAGDAEAAHGREDELWEEVLRAIANGADDAPLLAAEALKTTEIQFRRWYA